MTIKEFKQFCLLKAEKYEKLKEFIWFSYDEVCLRIDESDFDMTQECLDKCILIENYIERCEKLDLGTFIIFSYNPEISKELKSFIKSSVNVSLSNENSFQFSIEDIYNEIDNFKFQICEDDDIILDILVKSNVEYIEL